MADRRRPYSEFQVDWLAVIANPGLSISLAAIVAGKIASITGVGWIHLPTEGYWWFASRPAAS
ncbi:hypothetical protein ACVIGA_007534 [Bradyrhizobium sp. USDA 3240]